MQNTTILIPDWCFSCALFVMSGTDYLYFLMVFSKKNAPLLVFHGKSCTGMMFSLIAYFNSGCRDQDMSFYKTELPLLASTLGI
jgi:hypothetical protein